VSDTLQTWDTPHRVVCFGFVEGEDALIVAFDQGIAMFEPSSGVTDWLVGTDVPGAGLRFNDGKVDPTGRFWVGTMVEDPSRASGPGALFCLDPDAGLVERLGGIEISNGLCWSPDGTVMYHADSPTHSICAYGFDAREGTLSGRRQFATTARGVHPDGSTVDRDGGVWNAQWGGGQVVRYTHNGDIDMTISLPVSQPTCVAFGGADLDLLFVTSARQGLGDAELADEPLAGDLFVFRSGLRGLPAPRFRRPARPGRA
jgi:sugar lactone lactonase YvrE